ncbi:O-antigen ligase family protein [Metallumcola ferriviriculae]|uniref:O-antigen ligase family protein n=1 Tax=Metallumcola ferriviriculae TaxID=3039180 RepID=A0AAU0UQA3_9FIRM|nr:O-antigen ligase family protein [Desulfitibacteraceae bacterium MK1]
MAHIKENGYYWFAFVLFSFLLLLPSYFRGLFFPVEQSWALLGATIIAVLTYLWKLSQRDYSLMRNMLDYHILGLLAAYIIASFGAASAQLAVQEIVKMALYVYIFWLAANLGKDKEKIRYLMMVIYTSAVGVALAGFLTAVGTINIKDGFVSGRVFSTLQYANATASLLAAVSFLGLYLWYKGNTWQKYLFTAGNYFLLIVLLTTNSRGGFLVYIPAVLIFFLGFRKRWWTIYHWGFVMLGAFVANFKLIPSILAKDFGGAWGWLFMGLAVALVGQIILDIAGKFTDRDKFVAFVSVAVMIAALVGLFMAASIVVNADQGEISEDSILVKVMPEKFLTRIQSINSGDNSTLSRIYWMKDSFKLIKERPIFGWGGGAWESSYRRIQSYGYSSTQVHNHWLQMWTEIGTVGILILIGIWFYFFFTVWKNYRQGDTETQLLQWTIVAAAVMLGVHALIDFDLALSAVAIVLFSMFGFTRALAKLRVGEPLPISAKKFAQVKMRYVAVFAVFILFTFTLSAMLLLGNSYAVRGSDAFKAKNYNTALVNFDKAATFNPWQPSYHLDMAKLNMMTGKKEEGLKEVKKAVSLSPHDPRNYQEASYIAWREGFLFEALDLAEQSVENGPWMKGNWDNLQHLYVVAGVNLVAKGDQTQAYQVFLKAADMPDEMSEKYAALTETEKKLWGTRINPRLQPTHYNRLQEGIGDYFLGNWEKAKEMLTVATKSKKTNGEAYMWLSLIAEQEGNTGQAKKYLDQAGKLNPQIMQQYQYVKDLPILK